MIKTQLEPIDVRKERFTFGSCVRVQLIMAEKAQQQEQQLWAHIWVSWGGEKRMFWYSAGFPHFLPALGTMPLVFKVGLPSSENCLENSLTDTLKDVPHEIS